MHGVVFNELRRLAVSRWGPEGWEALRVAAGVERPMYLAFKAYPDAEGLILLELAARRAGQPLRMFLEELGTQMAPELVRAYGVLLRPGWTLFDVLEHAERLQRAARVAEGAVTVSVTSTRVAPGEVHLVNTARNGLCALWLGFLRGLATALGADVHVSERECAARGDARCLVVVRGFAGARAAG